MMILQGQDNERTYFFYMVEETGRDKVIQYATVEAEEPSVMYTTNFRMKAEHIRPVLEKLDELERKKK